VMVVGVTEGIVEGGEPGLLVRKDVDNYDWNCRRAVEVMKKLVTGRMLVKED
jgi:hypothetical protein